MKKTLLLLSFTLTATLAESAQNKTTTEVKMKTSTSVIIREVRTYRGSRSSRDIRKRTDSSPKLLRMPRHSRVQRVTHHVLKMPKGHLVASAH